MEIKPTELVDLGLTHGESQVYLALIESGPSTVGPLVKKTGVAYSNIYEILERLIRKGLASFVLKEGTKHFQAADPLNLMDYVESKEKEIEKQKGLVNKLLPRFKTIKERIPEQEAEIFIGLKGMRAAYRNLTYGCRGGEWLFLYMHKDEYADMSDRLYLSIKELLMTPDILRGIGDEAARKSKLIKRYPKIIKHRFVDFPIPGNIDIYNDKILILSWSKSPVAFLIKSPQIASELRDYFESVWKLAKE